jgi:putative ABC transport system substrate-binding protein
MSNRRQFITLLGGAAAVWPLAAHAQQPAMPVVGFLHTRSSYAPAVAAFQKALREAGFVEGQTVGIDYRWADGQYDQLAAMAADLVGQKVAVLVAGTIPIVFVVGSDPVKAGLVASYNRPGGNITGMNILTDTLEAKRLGMLHELVPQAATIAFLVNPRFASAASQSQDAGEAARGLALSIDVLPASTESEIEGAFETIVRRRILALTVGADPFFDTHRDKIIALAAQHAVPTMYQFREHAAAGGLISYGVDISDAWGQVGTYTARILRGEKPATLPVLQPTKFEMVINLTTAKALNLQIPDKLLALADEVIE